MPSRGNHDSCTATGREPKCSPGFMPAMRWRIPYRSEKLPGTRKFAGCGCYRIAARVSEQSVRHCCAQTRATLLRKQPRIGADGARPLGSVWRARSCIHRARPWPFAQLPSFIKWSRSIAKRMSFCRRSFEIVLKVVGCQKTSRNLYRQSPRTLEFKFCRDCFAIGSASVSMRDDETARRPSSVEQIRCGATCARLDRSIPESPAASRSRTRPVGSPPAHASNHTREAP